MLRELTSVEWLQWKAFMQAHPFHYDQERADMRAAMIALAIWNVQIAKGKQPKYRKIEEFLSKWGDAEWDKWFEKKRNPRELWDDLKAYADSLKAKQDG